MWKKRFLPYSKEDTKSSPLNLESKKPLDELQHVRGLVQHQPQAGHGHIPPPAHQSSSRMPTASSITPEPPVDPHWNMATVPVQHIVPRNSQTNPINHMHQQQVLFDMEMYRRQQIYEAEYKHENFHEMPDADMYNVARAITYPSATPHSQEMVHQSAMQWYQHERYLRQARDMQMADLHAEQVERERFKRIVAEKEIADNVASREASEKMNNERLTERRSYRAVMRNGELVQAVDGYLMITDNVVVGSNVQDPVYTSHNTTTQDSPLNLSVKNEMPTHHHADTDSGYNPSPQSVQVSSTAMNLVTKDASMQVATKIKASGVTIILPPAQGVKFTKLLPKIAPKPAVGNVSALQVQPKDEVIQEDSKAVELTLATSSPTLPEDIKTLFPHLKMTNTGSLVLWNFLCALLKDDNYKKIVTWISFPGMKFRIVNPSLLATLWGQVKQNPSMDWCKIQKILDLYLRKNLISSGRTEHEFTFLIVPKAIKETLRTEK